MVSSCTTERVEAWCLACVNRGSDFSSMLLQSCIIATAYLEGGFDQSMAIRRLLRGQEISNSITVTEYRSGVQEECRLGAVHVQHHSIIARLCQLASSDFVARAVMSQLYSFTASQLHSSTAPQLPPASDLRSLIEMATCRHIRPCCVFCSLAYF